MPRSVRSTPMRAAPKIDSRRSSSPSLATRPWVSPSASPPLSGEAAGLPPLATWSANPPMPPVKNARQRARPRRPSTSTVKLPASPTADGARRSRWACRSRRRSRGSPCRRRRGSRRWSASRVCSSPSRSTTTSTVSLGRADTTVPTSSHSVTGSPSMLTMSSPDSRPAVAAAAPAVTLPTDPVLGTGLLAAEALRQAGAAGHADDGEQHDDEDERLRKCIVEPARHRRGAAAGTTAAGRCGARRPASTSSRLFIPMIRT